MKFATGFSLVAEAAGENTAPVGAVLAVGVIGWPVPTLAAGFAADEPPPTSRRVNAATVHISDAAPGTSPTPPAVSHDSKPAPTPSTEPVAAAARGDAVITGVAAAAGPAALTTDNAAEPAAGPDEPATGAGEPATATCGRDNGPVFSGRSGSMRTATESPDGVDASGPAGVTARGPSVTPGSCDGTCVP
jgi:hypothetical protein